VFVPPQACADADVGLVFVGSSMVELKKSSGGDFQPATEGEGLGEGGGGVTGWNKLGSRSPQQHVLWHARNLRNRNTADMPRTTRLLLVMMLPLVLCCFVLADRLSLDLPDRQSDLIKAVTAAAAAAVLLCVSRPSDPGPPRPPV
jgi:hypothetical protein